MRYARVEEGLSPLGFSSFMTDRCFLLTMQTKSAWRAGLHPLSVGVSAMQIHVVFPGVYLLPSRFTFVGRGHWANPNPKMVTKTSTHIPWPRGSFPQSHLDLGWQATASLLE